MEAAAIIPLPTPAQAASSPPVDPFDLITGGALAITAGKAARLLDCSLSQIYKLINAGQLPAIRLGTGKRAGLRIPTAALREFIDAGGATDDHKPTPEARLARARAGKSWG